MQSAEARALLLAHAMVHDVFDDGRFVSLSTTVPNDDSLIPFQRKVLELDERRCDPAQIGQHHYLQQLRDPSCRTGTFGSQWLSCWCWNAVAQTALARLDPLF